MPLINSASAVLLGTTPAKAVYRQGVLVWPPGAGNRVNASLALKSGSTVTLTVSWNGDTPLSFKVWVSINGGAWSYWTEQTQATSYDYTTTYSTSVRMKVEAYYGGYAPPITVLTGTVTIGAAPPPPTQQKFWESAAAGSRTYNGSNADRGVAEMYYGYYSSTNGLQKSRFWFNIPADMRNCISIDRIDLAIWGQHTFPNNGNQMYLAIIHDVNNVGSTGALNWTFNVPKGGWVGPHDGSGWCLGLQGLTSAGRTSMAEEFRVLGAVGFQLVATTTAQSGYGYCQGATQANYPRMRVWYTVYT